MFCLIIYYFFVSVTNFTFNYIFCEFQSSYIFSQLPFESYWWKFSIQKIKPIGIISIYRSIFTFDRWQNRVQIRMRTLCNSQLLQLEARADRVRLGENLTNLTVMGDAHQDDSEFSLSRFILNNQISDIYHHFHVDEHYLKKYF